MSIVIDEVLPLVVIRWPAGGVTDEEVTELVNALRQLRTSGRPHYLAIDTTRASLAIHAGQRRIFAAWLKEAPTIRQGRVLGVGVVVANTIIRGAITAVFWLQPPKTDSIELFPNLEAVFDHATATLEAAGIPVPIVTRRAMRRHLDEQRR